MINSPEANALRRIALLVNRAREDCSPIRDDLGRIATIVDQMKRSVLLDVPMDKEAAKLSLLVHRLDAYPSHASASCARLCAALVHELEELIPLLTPASSSHRRAVPPAA